MNRLYLQKCVYLLGLSLALTFTAGKLTWAGTVSQCTGDSCFWSIEVDGQEVASGTYESDPVTGELFLVEPVVVMGDGYSVNLSDISGNIDPVLGFGLGATNNSADPKSFAFAFSLPLGGLPVPIATTAQLGTTLTAFTSAGGTVFPTLGGGKIVDSQDFDFQPVFTSVDKGVDIGDGLTVGSQTTATSIENATGLIATGGPYDMMSVTVAFGLTANTGAGFSGFVEQTAVPIPAAVWLFGTGLIGLIGVARRKA